MEVGQMKNIVVLKNLPSNLVEEAIVVLKPTKKVKQTLSSFKETQKREKGKVRK